MTSAFQLNGALTITQNSLSDVGQSLDLSVHMKEAYLDRTAYKREGTYTYYIKANYNLNSLISYEPSSTENLLDDAYAFAGLTVTSANGSGIELSLPTASGGLPVVAGLIEADNDQLVGNKKIGEFPVQLVFALDREGTITVEISVTGSQVEGSIVDNSQRAQIAYWDVNAFPTPTPGSTTPDKLVDQISKEEVTTHFANQLDAVKALYEGMPVVASWSMTLDALASGNDNDLAKYARLHNASTIGSTLIFTPGEIVMAKNPFSYKVEVKDFEGNQHVIIDNTDVYGIFCQTA